MAMREQMLASGPGWRVSDVLCSSGPDNPAFEEQHASVCIAAVMRGTFQYRTTQGAATLVPGAILLGNQQSCFECGHDHSTGDRCISFTYDSAYFETIVSSVKGVRSAWFQVAYLPPLMSLTRLFSDAQFSLGAADPVLFEQIAIDLAAGVAGSVAECEWSEPNASRRDGQRIVPILRCIEADSAASFSVNGMAQDAGMSPYHFLRTFRRLVGMTPHQFILRTRLQDAAVRLRRSSDTVLDIALDTGFGDLSTFNRRFRRTMGMTPGAYRLGRR